MPKKTGVCLNIGNCSKARKKEIQTVETSNFVCEECGRDLKEKKGGSGSGDKKLIAAILAAIILLAGGGASWWFLSDQSGETIVVEEPKTGGDSEGPILLEPTSGTDLGSFTWTGAVDENGLPHDTNGRMFFKKRQRISQTDDQERYAEEGESIVGEYVHGKLVQGKWYKKDGNVEVIMIGQ